MSDTSQLPPIALEAFSPEQWDNPYPYYHRLRREHPLLYDEERDVWLLTRYADCEAVLRDPRWSSNPAHIRKPRPIEEASVREAMAYTGSNVLLFMDPPDHTRIRNLVSRNFTPRAVARLRPRIEQIVDDLLDQAAEKGELEIVGEYGFVVPVTVICELLGVPVEDRERFGPWSQAASRLLDGELDKETMTAGILAAMELINYLNPLIEERRKHPRDDLLSHLVHAEHEEHRLSDQELRALTLLLFVAGHETTMNLIGNGMKALLEHPDQLDRLREDPTLVVTAVEECLRYDGPVHVTGRIPTEDITLAGHTFPKGCQVVTLLAAANRDPAEFPDPDRFDITRHPNHHLAFSKGIHHCLGASLARLEAQIAIGRLVSRFGTIEMITERPRYREHFVLRGLRELRVSLREPRGR
ncbi:MAG: biotin biosynthesis cytochrome P450 [Acidimicrobiales bacterium]|nr:MAG: biotin biosynthesis cytochrome P450 [Acidimicrobiales bacterium]